MIWKKRIFLLSSLIPWKSFDVASFVVVWCKTPVEEIRAAVDGAISPEQAVKLCQCLSHIDELEKHLEEIEREILRHSDKYEAALDLIRTVPGFDKNPTTAIQILSEIGGDMSVFPTANHLVSWAGCCPRNDQSNKKSNQLEFPALVIILNQYWYKLQMVYCGLRNILK